MFIRSTLLILPLALPLVAQVEVTEEKPVPAQSTQSAATAFYQAYFLDREQARSKEATAKAIGLYSTFLATSPDHRLAGKAATRCMIMIYSTGDLEAGGKFAKKYEALIAKTEAAERETQQSRRGGGRQEPGPNQEVSQKLRDAMMNARDDGDDALQRRLAQAMRRLGGNRFAGRGNFGGRGGAGTRGGQQRGNRRGGFGIPKIAEMKPEEAKEAVSTWVSRMERAIDFMAQRGQADQADALEAKLDKLQDLVDGGKLVEAQKILDGLQEEMTNMFRRGGRRGGAEGGGQGGRRRRDAGKKGGEGGAEEGGRRRRDAGEGDEEGGRRRR